MSTKIDDKTKKYKFYLETESSEYLKFAISQLKNVNKDETIEILINEKEIKTVIIGEGNSVLMRMNLNVDKFEKHIINEKNIKLKICIKIFNLHLQSISKGDKIILYQEKNKNQILNIRIMDANQREYYSEIILEDVAKNYSGGKLEFESEPKIMTTILIAEFIKLCKIHKDLVKGIKINCDIEKLEINFSEIKRKILFRKDTKNVKIEKDKNFKSKIVCGKYNLQLLIKYIKPINRKSMMEIYMNEKNKFLIIKVKMDDFGILTYIFSNKKEENRKKNNIEEIDEEDLEI